MKRFRARDGALIAYREEGSGPAMLLLHGLNAQGEFFAPQFAAFADRRLIAPDFRGHGDSPPAADADIALLARDTEDLIAHLGLDDVMGVGWSLGAMVLWDVAAGPAAARIAACVSIDMTPRLRNDAGWGLGLRDAGMRAPPPGETRAARGRRIAEFVVAADAPDRAALVDWMAPRLAVADPGTIAALNADLARVDYRDVLPRIAVPLLAVGGADSRFYGAATQTYIAERARRGRALLVPRTGHAPHLERPGAFNQLVRSWWGGDA